MVIQVIGSGCDKCSQLYENAVEAVRQLGLEAEIHRVEDLVEIVKLGVMTAPSMLVDGKLVVSGRVPNVKTIVGILKKASQ